MNDREVLSFKVTVSCIFSLDEFYVYKAAEEETIAQMQMMLNKKTTSEVYSMGESIKEGDVVAAQFSVDQVFYRAKVISKVVELELDLTEVDLVEVFFIDFGNTATIPVTSIRPLSPVLLALPALAIKCCLFDCIALGKDTTTEFSKLVSGHLLLMEVMGSKEEVLEVDLVREVGDNIGYTSIRDVLVLSGKAVFYSRPDLTIPNVEERKYKQLSILPAGSTHTVMVSHQHKLSQEQLPQLSVQLLSDEQRGALQLPSLMEQMKAVYRAKRSEELWGLGRCWPGMVCAVRDSRDKLWYRGEVITTIRGRMILVKYVDFGNTEQVPAHRMRRLFTDFLELPAMAMRVCMGVRVEGEETMCLLKESVNLVELSMKIVQAGSEKILPTVDLEVEGNSVSEWLRQVQTMPACAE